MKSIVSAVLAHKKASTVWSIGPNAVVIDAIQLMDEKNIGDYSSPLDGAGRWTVILLSAQIATEGRLGP
jgi:hypothetical protein